jgi:hypothetical protein
VLVQLLRDAVQLFEVRGEQIHDHLQTLPLLAQEVRDLVLRLFVDRFRGVALSLLVLHHVLHVHRGLYGGEGWSVTLVSISTYIYTHLSLSLSLSRATHLQVIEQRLVLVWLVEFAQHGLAARLVLLLAAARVPALIGEQLLLLHDAYHALRETHLSSAVLIELHRGLEFVLAHQLTDQRLNVLECLRVLRAHLVLLTHAQLQLFEADRLHGDHAI